MPLFNWNSDNVRKVVAHGLTPAEVEEVFENSPFDIDRLLRNGEDRTVYLGENNRGRVLVVVVTERDGGLRCVTSFPATRKQRAYYWRKRNAQKAAGDPRLQE